MSDSFTHYLIVCPRRFRVQKLQKQVVENSAILFSVTLQSKLITANMEDKTQRVATVETQNSPLQSGRLPPLVLTRHPAHPCGPRPESLKSLHLVNVGLCTSSTLYLTSAENRDDMFVHIVVKRRSNM